MPVSKLADKFSSLSTELSKSIAIRKNLGLPESGKVTTQLVTNGYGDFKRVIVRHNGKEVKIVSSESEFSRLFD